MANTPDPIPAPSRLGSAAGSFCLGLIGLGLCWLPPWSLPISAIGLLCGLWALLWPGNRPAWSTMRWAAGGTVLSLLGLGAALFLWPGGFFHL